MRKLDTVSLSQVWPIVVRRSVMCVKKRRLIIFSRSILLLPLPWHRPSPQLLRRSFLQRLRLLLLLQEMKVGTIEKLKTFVHTNMLEICVKKIKTNDFYSCGSFFRFSTERSSPGRKSATLEHCNCQQESGTSDRGNTVFIEILFGSYCTLNYH